MINNILTIAVVVGGIIFYYYLNRTGERNKTTQDLIRFNAVIDKGIIELPDKTYRAALEVTPVNMHNRTDQEKASILETFSQMLNSLNVGIAFHIQSRDVNIEDYLDALYEKASKVNWGPIQDNAQKKIDYFRRMTQDRSVKERRSYIVLEFNPEIAQSGMQFENESLQKLMQSFGKQKLSGKDSANLARQELKNAVDTIAAYAQRMGMKLHWLDQTALMEVMYAALNRELSAMHRFNSYHYDGVFSPCTESIYTNKEAEEIEHTREDNEEKTA